MLQSSQLFQTAQQFLPGGVSSPVRAFKNVGREPFFVQRGSGAYLFDIDNQKYIDYVCSWGPLILGHAHPEIVAKVTETLQKGFSFGAPHSIEINLAQKITQLMPAIEKLRFVSSGTEAVMSALRLARGFTRRDKIIKFAGCYHGHSDSMLVAAGSGALTLGVPSSAGVTTHVAQDTLVANYNNLAEVQALFTQYPEQIAAIIVEPVAGNMNLVLPQDDFLAGLRKLCDQYQSLLIFDEVITGFRVGLGGAQAHYDIKPDLTILGKIIGGGFPAAAFGGKREIMNLIAPLGPVYQAGTLSGNPVAMAAGLTTLELISKPGFYTDLINKTVQLAEGLRQVAVSVGIPLLVVQIGAMFGLFFTEQQMIRDESDVQRCDIAKFTQFFGHMLNAGIYLAPSAFEIGFMSAAHSEADIEKTLIAAKETLIKLK